MKKHNNRVFNNEDVILHGNEYLQCTFNNCRFIYDGTGPTVLGGCNFDRPPFFIFPAAAGSLILFLSNLYRSGGQWQGIVEGIFENIRRGNFSRQEGDVIEIQAIQ